MFCTAAVSFACTVACFARSCAIYAHTHNIHQWTLACLISFKYHLQHISCQDDDYATDDDIYLSRFSFPFLQFYAEKSTLLSLGPMRRMEIINNRNSFNISVHIEYHSKEQKSEFWYGIFYRNKSADNNNGIHTAFAISSRYFGI